MLVWSPVELVVEVDATLELLELLEVLEVLDVVDDEVDELPVEDPVPDALFVPEEPVPLAPELDPVVEGGELEPLDEEFPDPDPELPEAPEADPLLPTLPASP